MHRYSWGPSKASKEISRKLIMTLLDSFRLPKWLASFIWYEIFPKDFITQGSYFFFIISRLKFFKIVFNQLYLIPLAGIFSLFLPNNLSFDLFQIVCKYNSCLTVITSESGRQPVSRYNISKGTLLCEPRASLRIFLSKTLKLFKLFSEYEHHTSELYNVPFIHQASQRMIPISRSSNPMGYLLELPSYLRVYLAPSVAYLGL